MGHEACDDGNNFNGKYGFCKSDCTGEGPYCGDGNVTSSNEVCDPSSGTPLPSPCHSDCSGYCGDGRPNNEANGSDSDFEGCDYGSDPVHGNGKDGNGPEVTSCRS